MLVVIRTQDSNPSQIHPKLYFSAKIDSVPKELEPGSAAAGHYDRDGGLYVACSGASKSAGCLYDMGFVASESLGRMIILLDSLVSASNGDPVGIGQYLFMADRKHSRLTFAYLQPQIGHQYHFLALIMMV